MLVQISDLEDPLLLQMIQDYEEEFSAITGKKRGPKGRYTLDTDLHFPNSAFYWIEDGKEAGFCVRAFYPPQSDIGEFYVLPQYRKKGVGKKFAFALFDHFPGPWQVRQIEGAEEAKLFWRSVISAYTNGVYQETHEDDPIWGRVTCQRFFSQKCV